MTFGDRIDWEKKISHDEGFEEGRQEGMNILADAISRLRNGSTVEELVKDGIDRDVAEMAESCK